MTTGSWRAVDPECFLVGWKIHHTAACPLRVRRSPPLALAPFDPLLIGPVDEGLAGDTKPLRVVRDRALSDRRLAPAASRRKAFGYLPSFGCSDALDSGHGRSLHPWW